MNTSPRRLPYEQLVGQLRDLVEANVPRQGTVLVVSKGDGKLLELKGRRAWHFPPDDQGGYAGYNPADSAAAIAQLETLRRKGAEFIVFPGTAFWWLEHYGEFRQYLLRQYQVMLHQQEVCVIFDLRASAGPKTIHFDQGCADFRSVPVTPDAEAFLSALVVYHSPVAKTRLGRDNDGGYVICDHLGPYDLLLSGGIGDDNSFEIDFIGRYHVDCYAFDHSVDNAQEEHPRLKFIKKSIGPINSEHSSNLKEFTSQCDNSFLKLDIEGGEFAWISALAAGELLKLKQIVIEIHGRFGYDFSEIGDLLGKLNANHVLVHFHANNCCSTFNVGGIAVPKVFECTFIRKDCYPPPWIPNQDPIPSVLDRPNLPARPDICLSGWPFVPLRSEPRID